MKLVGAIPIKFLQSRKIKGRICINLLIDCGACAAAACPSGRAQRKGPLARPFLLIDAAGEPGGSGGQVAAHLLQGGSFDLADAFGRHAELLRQFVQRGATVILQPAGLDDTCLLYTSPSPRD